MKGSNTLLFNGATMIQAAQEYLDKRLTTAAGSQIVKSVVYDGSNSVFKIFVEEKAK